MTPRFFSSSSVLLVLAFAGTFFALTAPGCTSKNDAAAPTCDNTKCLPGNKCLPLGKDTECRKTCSSNSDPTASCPFGYTCVSQPVVEPFCMKDNTTITPNAKGQWGAPCNASGGLDSNPDCDTSNPQFPFYCYGASPTDGAAYCTQYACTTDRDCAAGYWCGNTNVAPNVTTSTRTIGQTQKVCLRRTYGASCQADLDCPPVVGKTQHCQPDNNGNGFCTPECTTTDNCNNEAKCFDTGNGYKVCYPRAGAIIGDTSFCSPCLSDADCGDDGACLHGQFTTEHFCAKKSKIVPCVFGTTAQVQGTDYDCPPKPTGVKAVTACIGSHKANDNGLSNAFVPPDYCHGMYQVGGEYTDIGCYTPDR